MQKANLTDILKNCDYEISLKIYPNNIYSLEEICKMTENNIPRNIDMRDIIIINKELKYDIEMKDSIKIIGKKLKRVNL